MTAAAMPAPAASLRRDLRAARVRKSRLRALRDSVVVVVACVIASLLIQAFVVRSFYVPSTSMMPTLNVGDRMIVDELTPTLTGYHRGDIVVFTDPGGWLPAADGADGSLVKRVIGLPGDTVQGLGDGTLRVNGATVREPWAREATQAPFTVTVPAGRLWVEGDNRAVSGDSRFHGTVPIADVTGRVVWKYWPEFGAPAGG